MQLCTTNHNIIFHRLQIICAYNLCTMKELTQVISPTYLRFSDNKTTLSVTWLHQQELGLNSGHSSVCILPWKPNLLS